MAKYRKKPVVVDALQFTGTNYDEIFAWAEKVGTRPPVMIQASGGQGLNIGTLEGPHVASHGDWIICGVAGEFYACKPHIFEQTYEPAEKAELLDLVLWEVAAERERQDEKWGGPAHDDDHDYMDWRDLVEKHVARPFNNPDLWPRDEGYFRRQMIRVAALAVAAVEWVDRRQKGDTPATNENPA